MRSERSLLQLQLPGRTGAMNRMLELIKWHNHISAAMCAQLCGPGRSAAVGREDGQGEASHERCRLHQEAAGARLLF